MTNEELVKLIKDNQDVKENMAVLWKQNKGLIRKIALQYSECANIDDMMQESYFALYEAVKHYDPSHGVKFDSYAGYWIKQMITRYIDNYGRMVRIPVAMCQKIRNYKKAAVSIVKGGKKPDDKELCEIMGIDIKELREIQAACVYDELKSLNVSVDDSDQLELIDIVQYEDDDRIERHILKQELYDQINRLPELEQQVIIMYYFDDMTSPMVEKALGLNDRTSYFIRKKAINRLRKYYGAEV